MAEKVGQISPVAGAKLIECRLCRGSIVVTRGGVVEAFNLFLADSEERSHGCDFALEKLTVIRWNNCRPGLKSGFGGFEQGDFWK